MLSDIFTFSYLDRYYSLVLFLVFMGFLLLKYAIYWFSYLTLRKLWAKYQDYQPVLPASASHNHEDAAAASDDVDDESTHLLHRQQTATDDLFSDVLVDQSV